LWFCFYEIYYIQDGVISFTKNGRPLGEAFRLPQPLRGQVLYPAICLKNAEMGFNFGSDLKGTPFKFAPPQGYTALALAGDTLVSAEQVRCWRGLSHRRRLSSSSVSSALSSPFFMSFFCSCHSFSTHIFF
jgi:hypothetical protein